jgi:hypothetical protein
MNNMHLHREYKGKIYVKNSRKTHVGSETNRKVVSRSGNGFENNHSGSTTLQQGPFLCLWGGSLYSTMDKYTCRGKIVDRMWEYIDRSQTHECGNWD